MVNVKLLCFFLLIGVVTSISFVDYWYGTQGSYNAIPDYQKPYRPYNQQNYWQQPGFQQSGFQRSGFQQDKVRIDLYYECLCPDCIQFDTIQFKDVVDKLAPYLDIHTYPYGNAKTYERDLKIWFKCQHGPAECYGNKLHACALRYITNQTQALDFNSCMMDSSQGRRSDDQAADQCAQLKGFDASAIKSCAKGSEGDVLLKYYGDASKKANFKYVPYILVNGAESDGKNFFGDVCKAFINKPQPCLNVYRY